MSIFKKDIAVNINGRPLKTHSEKEIIEMSFLKWDYLARHPEVDLAFRMPACLYETIRESRNNCLFCEWFSSCDECPLGSCQEGSAYHEWFVGKTNEERELGAKKVRSLIDFERNFLWQ